MEIFACINQILDRDFFFSFSLAKKKIKINDCLDIK